MSKLIPILTTCSVVAAGTFALSAPQAYSEFTSTSSLTGNSVTAGSISVEIVDASGQTLATPIISVTDAYPAMAARTSTLRLYNAGSLPAAVNLHSADLEALTSANLNDVLQVRVLNAGGTALYTGKVGSLEVLFESLAPASTTVLTIELTWPDLPAVDDNPYQDAALNFGLVADASNLVG